jgi:hypothetical protein
MRIYAAGEAAGGAFGTIDAFEKIGGGKNHGARLIGSDCKNDAWLHEQPLSGG